MALRRVQPGKLDRRTAIESGGARCSEKCYCCCCGACFIIAKSTGNLVGVWPSMRYYSPRFWFWQQAGLVYAAIYLAFATATTARKAWSLLLCFTRCTAVCELAEKNDSGIWWERPARGLAH